MSRLVWLPSIAVLAACGASATLPRSEVASTCPTLEGDSAELGALVACTPDPHGAQVSYRTTRADGAPAVAGARVIVPASAARRGYVVVAHGTLGLADACAPSRVAPDELVRAWTSRGWAVIAPDYAGLGGPGVQGYLDGEDTARSVLDAARAMRRFVPEGSRAVLTGHSQGGGAILSAQTIARRYAPELDVAAAIAIAPGWPVRTRIAVLRDPARRTRRGDELSAVVGALLLYSWHARTYGEAHAGEGFPVATRERLVRAVERGCVGSLLESVPRIAPTFGALIDEPLRAGFVACEDGTEGCDPRAQALHQWARRNVLGGDPEGAPIEIVQGLRDGITTPSRTRCIVEHLRASGIDPRVCALDADHLSIVPRGSPYALAAADARVGGAPLPSCEPRELPACDPNE